MDFIVYILFSEIKKQILYWFQFPNIEERLKRHNQKQRILTGTVKWLKLVHTENYFTKERRKEN
jgi:predicted GIY-YIG superfamily endonuclease